MGKLRILHCLETVGSGGVEQLKLIKARQLDKNKYDQALVCTQAIGALPAQFASAGCPIHEIGVFRGIFDRERYARALMVVREFKPHIIHGAVYEGVAVAALVGRLAGVPVILGEETSDPVNRRWSGHLLYRGLAALTHHMIAVSPAVQDYLVNRIKLPTTKVTLINNGVADTGPASAERKLEARENLGIRPDDFIIGSCGRLLDEHKRFSDLIHAFVRVRQQVGNARLLIIGDGPDEAMLRGLAGQLGVSDDVLFAGYQGETRPYYDIMDIFALASAHEAFGLVLVEAMHAGLPVVATRVGGIPTVVRHGETGFLVEPKDPAELAEKLLVLTNDSSLRKSMGRVGHERAKAEFGAGRYVRLFDELYQCLAAKRVN